ncbi:hypothetical protein [Promicromonospora sukumoe]|uniref:hypothetical protein n=1 Tax=Promicromonospora sukumoe TaxID=88382 RepID=UPI00035F1F2C|nr:hypothetical protein [Promicromonospora sukumoe]NUS88469.1 hypothetical protein [Streptomyces sp.]
MSLWGPAIDAEIEYRQERARSAWHAKRPSAADRAARQEKRAARANRTEQIRAGIAGMRPAPAARRGLFA